MIFKHTFAVPAAFDFDQEGVGDGQGKKIANGCELSYMKLTGNGGPGYVEIYDAKDSSGATYPNLKLVLDSSTTTPDDNFFPAPLVFKQGIFALLQQGSNFKNVLTYATIGQAGTPKD